MPQISRQAREYSSFDRWRADKLRERRVAWDPQRSFQAPLTAQQEVGWHALKPRFRMPTDVVKLSSTDVTKREGRTATSYYGYMNMLGA
ncbi:flagellar associated protein [Monoraphidium neglectum]|uniref:Flagellar associated protein n=1 Tax=Monoraphidium neglectum TaxID=145388 RepID=A0A0D2MI63_9CHLO|nr:flagellar associated protein [Monoraphidium neglectum]KIZ02710.1 flagellar associated protein [Monoraphidium neglectum]|eukprot:XP_013901729.1 flagellar associated protein [Monoraphidium neglectum]